MTYTRYALYYAPPADAEWGKFASRWLGWDLAAGATLSHPDLGLPVAQITQTPRKYGLHATIKPPFRLAGGTTEATLKSACATLCRQLAPVRLEGLTLARLGRFLALRPVGDEDALNTLAARCVAQLDPFRAPAFEAELAKRRAGGLNPAQEAHLTRWGYPYVMDAFRFHITLTSRMSKGDLPGVEAALANHLLPLLPRPFDITELALVGEDGDGRFHLIHRYALSA